MNWKVWKKEKKVKRELFPCSSDNCLVRAACTQACEKLITDEDELTKFFQKHRCCPDCGSKEFFDGPSGGAAINIKCAGCGHWFNNALPLFVQRIHLSPNGSFGRFER